MLEIKSLDHLVLTVVDLQSALNFYQHVLNMKVTQFADDRYALKYGSQKINLHVAGKEFEPKSKQPTPGSADLCFITETEIEDVVAHLQTCDIEIIEGPVERTGAVGKLMSIYVRDPDGNLIEVSNLIS